MAHPYFYPTTSSAACFLASLFQLIFQGSENKYETSNRQQKVINNMFKNKYSFHKQNEK